MLKYPYMQPEKLKLDLTYSSINLDELASWQPRVIDAHNQLHQGTGLGKEFLGWLKLPENYDKEEFKRIKETAQQIRSDSDALIVIGIGGSYLGARAVIEALASEDEKARIHFAGNNLSSIELNKIKKIIQEKDVSLNVISKSGTTTEPAAALRILKPLMEEKYGSKASDRIYATTDKEKGALKKMATEQGFKTFVVPDDIGGRYSVLTAVGLLPIAVANINIDQLMAGAKAAMEDFDNQDLFTNDCYKYAAVRNILHASQSKVIEILVNYEPQLNYMSEWWKQLYGESEGKDGKGIFPASVSNTTDLHSMGQFIQDGPREFFETVVSIEEDTQNLVIPEDSQNLDELNYLAGKTLDYVNKVAMEATIKAHTAGGVPNLLIRVPKLDEYNLGYLSYLWEKACGISGYLLKVNPFDQEGVEVYKKQMFHDLGKPGY